MYRNLLLPVALDHNAHVPDCFEAARRLGSEGAKFTLMHVIEAIPAHVASYLPEGTQKDREEEAQASLAAMAGELGLPVEIRIVSGHSGRTIVDYADANEIDCIIIASHRPGLQDYFLGSTSGHVVRHADCSVHVVR